MSNPAQFVEYWQKRIPRDLYPFVDPGTELVVHGDGRMLTTEWVCRGQERQAQYAISVDQGVRVTVNGRTMTYQSFMVGPDMADLLGLAKMILQARRPSLYVSTKAILVDHPESHPAPAIDLINGVLNDPSGDATRMVIVTGEAGAGKTYVLQELVRRQALAYQAGESRLLYLYVNAQGRALARLAEALATELQDLRAQLTYHAVAVLVRLGVLVPVIDGFDELIGVSGYDDAFSSLSRFIEELDGEGQIVASARSAYYEEEFVSRSVSSSSLGDHAWVQVPIQVKAWDKEEFESFIQEKLAKEYQGREDTSSPMREIESAFSGVNERLKQKPLFVAKAFDLVMQGTKISGERDLLAALVDAYLNRERTEKLLGRNVGALLTAEQLATLLASLAEEMWNLETRELDRRSIRDVAEYVLATENVEESFQRIIIDRMPTLAFLAPGERPGSIKFEHELFFSLFLSKIVAGALLQPTESMRMLLSRSALPPEISGMVAADTHDKLAVGLIPGLDVLANTISELGQAENNRTGQVRENAGRLIMAILEMESSADRPVSKIGIRNVVFPGGSLAGVHLDQCVLKNVMLRRTDLSTTKIVRSSAYRVMLHEVAVDPQVTRLELRGVDPATDVFGLRLRRDSATEVVFDPDEVLAVLADCGTVERPEQPAPRWAISESYLSVVQRLMNAYRRANPVCTSDDNLRQLFRDSSWPRVQRLLIQHRLVTEESRATGGRPKMFLRRQVGADDLLAGLRKDAKVPANVRSFWEALEREILNGR